MTDLEQLSREAAEILDEKARRAFGVTEQGMIAAGMCGSTQWLHESTEACASIMVRVLWPLGVMRELIEAWFFDKGEDRMQAFRTAVLCALIEVKK